MVKSECIFALIFLKNIYFLRKERPMCWGIYQKISVDLWKVRELL